MDVLPSCGISLQNSFMEAWKMCEDHAMRIVLEYHYHTGPKHHLLSKN